MTDWWTRALCAPENRAPWITADFWTEPYRGQAWGTGGQRLAIKICQQCPVRLQCLQDAMLREGHGTAAKYRWGIWGATTPAMRARMAALQAVA